MEETRQAPRLEEVPVLRDYESPEQATAGLPVRTTTDAPRVGHLTREQVAVARPDLLSVEIDWRQVAELRRRASEVITEESGQQQGSGGGPLGPDDRLLLSRAVIRRLVGDHVRALHRAGAELWSASQEQAYVAAVEDSILGYGRLQPLLKLPTVENIEIHGCNLVKMVPPV